VEFEGRGFKGLNPRGGPKKLNVLISDNLSLELFI
jgi:hypothetical protein